MSDLEPAARVYERRREDAIRQRASSGIAFSGDVEFLAELLDAERAAREAAEGKYADAQAIGSDLLATIRTRNAALAAAEARTHALEAAARCLLSTSVSDPAWGDRAAELRALVDGGA